MNAAKIFTEYRERLVSFVRKRLESVEDAEDIVQDIFCQIARLNDTAKPIEQTTAWLFRVARNMIINHYGKKKSIPFSVLENMWDEDEEDATGFIDALLADDKTPETELLRSALWEEIQSAIDELPAPQREVFIQTEFLYLSVKEISEKTGVLVNTLLSRKHYAVVHLRKKLKSMYAEFFAESHRTR